MSGLPFMPLWIDDYLGDTQNLTLEEHGAYCLLIFQAWHHPEGLLLDDDKELARILRVQARVWKRCKARLMKRYFHPVERDGIAYWAHKRITEEKNKSIKISTQNQAAARARWDKKDEVTSKLRDSLDVTTSKQSPNLKPNSKENNDLADATAYASTTTATTTVEEEGVESAREPVKIISALDEAIAETYGENRRRLNPASTDIVFARRFEEWGADVELCKGVFLAKCSNRNNEGLSPPGSLKFFERDINNALAELSKPQPEQESYHDRPNQHKPDQISPRLQAAFAGADLVLDRLRSQAGTRPRDAAEGMVATGEPDTGTSEFDDGNVIDMQAIPKTGES